MITISNHLLHKSFLATLEPVVPTEESVMEIDRHPFMALLRELNGEQGNRSMLDLVAELDWHEPPWEARIPEGEGAFFNDNGGGQHSFMTRETEAGIATFNIAHKRWEPSLLERLHEGKPSQGFSFLTLNFRIREYQTVHLECYLKEENPVILSLIHHIREPYRQSFLLLSRELPNQTAEARQFVEDDYCGFPTDSTGLLDWFQKLVKMRKVGAIFAALLMLEAAVDHEHSVLQRFHRSMPIAA